MNNVTAARIEQVADALVAGALGPPVGRVILRVDTPDGAHTAVRGAFDATGRPLAADDPFRIASVSKLVTAATALALVDAGEWSLDAPLGRYLPDELVERVHVLDGVRAGPTLPLRRLLDHTSGLRDFFDHPSLLAGARAGGRRFRPRDLVELAIAGGPPRFAPGAGRAYTDTGFVLAGLAIEAVAGEPLHVVARRHVLEPAGMHHTWLESADDAPRTGPVSAHTWGGVDVTRLDPTIDWGGGGLVSTAADLARLVPALRTTVLRPPSWRAMSAWLPGPPGYYDDYGLGLGRYVLDDGVEAIGHHGAWGAFTFELPARGVVITGTVNAGPIDRRPIVAAVAQALA